MDTVEALWKWLTAATPAPSPVWVTATLVLGALLAATPTFWRRTRLLATYVHEASHALVALLTGRSVTSIRLAADTSGVTEHVGAASGLGRVLVAFAGYPGPALAGMGLAVAAASGHPRWGIALVALAAALLAVVQRSWRGWVLTLAIAGGCWGLGQISGVYAALGLGVVAGYLLMASPRTIVELHQVRRHGSRTGAPAHSDADTLAGLTGIPALFWEVLFLCACAACTWYAVTSILP